MLLAILVIPSFIWTPTKMHKMTVNLYPPTFLLNHLTAVWGLGGGSIHGNFLHENFFTECIFSSGPPRQLVFFYTWVFLHNVRFFSLPHMRFFTQEFFTECISPPAPPPTGSFLHVVFLHNVCFFLPPLYAFHKFYTVYFLSAPLLTGSLTWAFTQRMLSFPYPVCFQQ